MVRNPSMDCMATQAIQAKVTHKHTIHTSAGAKKNEKADEG
jgi:hypothetical protein